MIQFHTRGPGADWVIRYHAGSDPPWPAKVVAAVAPNDWQVVTRDLFADFGAVRLGGVAFSPLSGGDGLFDHMLLGRTVADLDWATAAAMLKTAPPADLRVKLLWENLGHADPSVAEAAVWTLVRGHKEAVPFLLKVVTLPDRKAPRPVDAAKVKPPIESLTHYRHVTRAAAADELFELGPGVLPHLRKATEAADGDAKVRLQAFLDGWGPRTGMDLVRLRRCATVLRAVGTPEVKELLAKIEAAVP